MKSNLLPSSSLSLSSLSFSSSPVPSAACRVPRSGLALLLGGLLAALGCSDEKGSGLGKDFRYDLTELRKVDPALIQYDEADSIGVPLEAPRGLALDAAGRLYVAGDEAVVALGTEAARLELGGAPNCLAVGHDGLLYVGMRRHVEVWDPKGERKGAWESLGERARITSVAVGDGEVFVADAGNRLVARYDLAGKRLGTIGKRDAARNIPGLVVPSPHLDVAIGREGLVWVVNPGRHKLEGYTPDGHLEVSWGKASAGIDGFCGCCNPTDFAVLPDGRFVTAEKGLPRVKVFSHDGTLEGVVAPPDSFHKDVAGLDLAVDAQGRILVLDPQAKKVRVFVRKGTKDGNP